MSTFDGQVAEFPDIRIDFFRSSGPDSTPPLAYFLSHVHSDHLMGLESSKSHFIYCSPATRDILLGLEKYPHRMNFAKGILETRKQTYRHLKNLLKAIPLETPTVIELSPGHSIRVTLFDANHCVGAVMFLIEGGGNAILYTGDVRSETWWVNSLTKNPVLLPYVWSSGSESIKRLDCIYLDTTFTVSGRKDDLIEFPPKADGLRELLQKVAQYPPDTLFYLDAWTFGYEDVWQALSTFLNSRIHVDQYKYGMYRALYNGVEPKASEAAKFMGFYCGNHFQQGCLSAKSNECRIHSCEKGTTCDIWDRDFVRITPIITRHGNVEVREAGAGGGHGDLNEQHELDVSDKELVGQLMALCASKLHDQPHILSALFQMLTSSMENRMQAVKLEDFNVAAESGDPTANEMDLYDTKDVPLQMLVSALARAVPKDTSAEASPSGNILADTAKRPDGLPKRITFPYSRHSSYGELCQLIEAFRPKDIYPCTVSDSHWTISSSMGSLFGHIYSAPPSFKHDQMMINKKDAIAEKANLDRRSSTSSESSSSDYATPKAQGSLPNTQQVTKSKTHRSVVSGQEDHSRRLRADDSKTISKESSEQVRVPQGDFWPPLEIDHYSPAPGTGRRASSLLPSSPRQIRQHNTIEAVKLTPTEKVSIERVENRERKRLANARSQEWQLNQDEPVMKRGRVEQSPAYERLSPPLNSEDLESDEAAVHEVDIDRHFDSLARSSRTSETKRLSMGRSYSSTQVEKTFSPAQERLAFRREAHDAALGKNGSDWSEIGLVSVNGHQAREEEL